MNKYLFLTILLFCRALECPVGLYNEGNTCYINATLQCLFACKPFVALMQQLDAQDKLVPDSVGIELNHLMLEHIVSEGPMAPTGFIDCTSQKQLLGQLAMRSQQDAGEFLVNLIYELTLADKRIRNLFDLVTSRHVECDQHRHDFKDLPVTTLRLPIITGQQVTLKGLLDNYFKKEPLELCPLDATRKAISEQTILMQSPDVLVVELLRAPLGIKNMQKVYYDLTPIMLETSQGVVRYRLTGCVFHVGTSFAGGHYYSVVNVENKWYLCDDSQVKVVDTKEVVSLLQGNNENKGQSYLLFFEVMDRGGDLTQLVKKDTSLNDLLMKFMHDTTALYVKVATLKI